MSGPTLSKARLREPTPLEVQRGKAVGAWLRAAAGSRAWGIPELAAAVKMSYNGISVLWNDCLDEQSDKIRRPGEATIEKIAAATGASLNEGLVAAGYKERSADQSVRTIIHTTHGKAEVSGVTVTPEVRSIIENALKIAEIQEGLPTSH